MSADIIEIDLDYGLTRFANLDYGAQAMTAYRPPAGKRWSDLQAQGQDNASDTASCELCGNAMYGWEADRARRWCGYCEAKKVDG